MNERKIKRFHYTQITKFGYLGALIRIDQVKFYYIFYLCVQQIQFRFLFALQKNFTETTSSMSMLSRNMLQLKSWLPLDVLKIICCYLTKDFGRLDTVLSQLVQGLLKQLIGTSHLPVQTKSWDLKLILNCIQMLVLMKPISSFAVELLKRYCTLTRQSMLQESKR